MKQITLKVPDSKYPFVIELVKNLGLEKVEEKPLSIAKEVLESIEEGFKEVKKIQEGEIEGTQLKDFLNEL